jgi:hypothetical protein
MYLIYNKNEKRILIMKKLILAATVVISLMLPVTALAHENDEPISDPKVVSQINGLISDDVSFLNQKVSLDLYAGKKYVILQGNAALTDDVVTVQQGTYLEVNAPRRSHGNNNNVDALQFNLLVANDLGEGTQSTEAGISGNVNGDIHQVNIAIVGDVEYLSQEASVDLDVKCKNDVDVTQNNIVIALSDIDRCNIDQSTEVTGENENTDIEQNNIILYANPKYLIHQE